MIGKNNKLAAFIVGWCLVWVSAWLIDMGYRAPVPESFQANSYFVAHYYPMMITAIFACLFTVCLTLLLGKLFNVKVGEYFLWLTLPLIAAMLVVGVFAQTISLSFISAALPMLLVISTATMIEKRDLFMPERLKVW